MQTGSKEHIWSVSSLCAAIDDAFARSWPLLAVSGEISNWSESASGHAYFTLKDANAQLRCVIFRRALSLLGFAPASGVQVQVRARLSLYQPRGDLQLVVESMARPSAGSLHEAFLALKEKLQAEGLFDAARKRELPDFVQTIGLVTSAAGAAQHDVLQTLARRAPHVRVLFAPASVQGANAPDEIMAALRALYAHQPDVILLVRGGGSAEDLSAFNHEQLARTIAASPVPLISGVGHETDFSIADFVADVRAATPTAAAEMATPERSTLLAELDEVQAELRYAVKARLQTQAQWLDHADMQLAHARSQTVQQQRALLQQLQQSAMHGAQQSLHKARHTLDMMTMQCSSSARLALQQRLQDLSLCEQRLLAVQTRRAQSSVLLQTASGYAINSVQDVQQGDAVQAILADGLLDLEVLAKRLKR